MTRAPAITAEVSGWSLSHVKSDAKRANDFNIRALPRESNLERRSAMRPDVPPSEPCGKELIALDAAEIPLLLGFLGTSGSAALFLLGYSLLSRARTPSKQHLAAYFTGEGRREQASAKTTIKH